MSLKNLLLRVSLSVFAMGFVTYAGLVRLVMGDTDSAWLALVAAVANGLLAWLSILQYRESK